MSGDKGGFGVVGAIEKTVVVEPGIAFRNFRELRQEVSAIQRGVGKIVFHAFQIQKEKIALLCRKVSGGYDGRFVIFFVKGAGRVLIIVIGDNAYLPDDDGSADCRGKEQPAVAAYGEKKEVKYGCGGNVVF